MNSWSKCFYYRFSALFVSYHCTGHVCLGPLRLLPSHWLRMSRPLCLFPSHWPCMSRPSSSLSITLWTHVSALLVSFHRTGYVCFGPLCLSFHHTSHVCLGLCFVHSELNGRFFLWRVYDVFLISARYNNTQNSI